MHVMEGYSGSLDHEEERELSIRLQGSKISSTSGNEKREDYLSWEDYFMALTVLSAKRSKDPCTQVGACIINKENKIVGIGYNGMPRGCSDDYFPWGKSSENELENKYMFVCHAEMNAVMNTHFTEIKGCTIYVTLFPCNECSKMIIQAGIKEIVYLSDKHESKVTTVASKKMLDSAGISYRKFKSKLKNIELDLTCEN